MDGVDHHLLARSRLPADQNIHVIIQRQNPDLIANLADCRTLADELFRPQLHQFQGSLPGTLLHASADDEVDFLQIKGLLNIVAYAQLHGFHSILYGTVGRHQDDDDILIQRPELRDVGQSRIAPQPVVQKDNVGMNLLHRRETLRCGFHTADLVPQILQAALQRHPNQEFIIYDQYFMFHHVLLPSLSCSPRRKVTAAQVPCPGFDSR